MPSRIAGLTRYLRFSPFDVATAEGRTAERYRRAALSVVANAASKGMAMLTLLATVALTLPYLGPERFGILMTVIGFAVALSILDLGIGNALINETVRVAAEGETVSLRCAISDGLAVMACVGAVAALLLVPAAALLPSAALFRNVAPTLHDEIRQSLLLFAVLFALGIPLQGLHRIVTGLQQAYVAHAVSAGAGAISLLLVVILAERQASIPALVGAIYGIQALAPLFLIPVLHRQNLLRLPDGWHGPRRQLTRLWRDGGMFLVIQIAVVAGWGMDVMILSSMLGASQAAVFVLVQKLYDLAYQPLAIANAPLWAAYADARARGDHPFMAATLARSTGSTLVFALVMAVVIIASHQAIFALWIDSAVPIPSALVFACGVWFVLQATGNAFAMYLNGAGIIRPQVVTSVAFVALALGFKLALVGTLGTLAIPTATAAAYGLAVILPYLTIFRATALKPIRA